MANVCPTPFAIDSFQAMIHLELLAVVWDIEVEWINGPMEAEAFPAARLVRIPRPRSRALFLIGLHEFGHVAAGPDERAAWKWAHDQVADARL